MAGVLVQDLIGAGLFGAAILWAVVTLTLAFTRFVAEPRPEGDDEEGDRQR